MPCSISSNSEPASSVGTDSEEKLIEIGVVGRAHGIAGELNVFLHNPDSTLLEQRERVLLRDASGTREVAVEAVRASTKCRVVRFAGVRDRTAAEKLKGAVLFVPRSAFPALSEDEFYIADLIGVDAYEVGKCIGTVTASRPQGDIEMVTVTGAQTSVEIPLVEDYLVSMDLAEGKIHFVDTAILPTNPVPKPRASRKPRPGRQ